MKRITFIIFFSFALIQVSRAQFIYPVAEYNSESNNIELSNFEIKDTVLYLPLGEEGLQVFSIADIQDFKKLSTYVEYEKRSRKKVYGVAHCINIIDNKAYLSYGPLGLKILNVDDPTMPYVLGTYYRHQDVYCSEIYKNYALLGYIGLGLEIVDLSNLDDIKMVSRNNISDYSVKNIQVIPPYVMITGGMRGVRTYKFQEPFTSFKQEEFPKDFITDNEANKLIIKGSVGYLANDFRGLTVLNLKLPLYPLEVKNMKTNGKTTDLIAYKNYLYVISGKSIEVYDIKKSDEPLKIYEYTDKDKEFVNIKIHNNHLYALYKESRKEYGFVVFQIE